jgi:4-carboxymuconolactone decarboxylase
VDVSAALATMREAPLADTLVAALDAGVDAVAVEEALLQAYLFLGYPAALNGFALWRELSGRRAPPPVDGDWEVWRARGERVCRQVYADQYESLQKNVAALHADLATWMLVEGYGQVLGRPGLELRARELCIVALLAVLNAPRQLRSHLRGALHAGATHEEVEEALARALRYTDEGVRSRARETWQLVRSRWDARDSKLKE